MKLSKLSKTTSRSKKRVGRGYGSGKGGHTVGRGTKGQKARGKVPPGFATIFSRLPLRRGRGKLLKKRKPLVVNVRFLNLLPANVEVTLETLAKHKIIDKVNGEKLGVKILGKGELKVPLRVILPCSSGAVEKIKAAGGEVVKPETKKLPSPKVKSLPKTKKAAKSRGNGKTGGGKK